MHISYYPEIVKSIKVKLTVTMHRVPRFLLNHHQHRQHLSLFRLIHDSTHKIESELRLKAFREITQRVDKGRECWAWQIQNVAFLIRNNQAATNHEVNNLLRACQMDIVDLFPADQKLLTEIVWDYVKQANINDGMSLDVYNNKIRAYNFQDLQISTEEAHQELKSFELNPSVTTHIGILENLAIMDSLDSVLEYRDRQQIDLNVQMAAVLIFAYTAAGHLQDAEFILKQLNEKNIHWGRSIYKNFVLGSARHGDLDVTNFFLSKFDRLHDELLLQVIQQLNLKNASKVKTFCDRLPINLSDFSSSCRRTIKILLESGNSGAAWKLAMKSRQVRENNTEKERVIKICPSVMVLKHYISENSQANQILNKIYELKVSDPKIVERSVLVLIDVCIDDPDKIPVAKEVIKKIKDEASPKELESVKQYVGQISKRRITEASKSSDDELLRVFGVFCQLGLTLDKLRSWDVLIRKLVPEIPDNHDSWTQAQLFRRCFYVKNILMDASQGVYSQSVIWSQILKHLINRENDLFFKTAASLVRELKVAYGPIRWYLSLSNCLVKTGDVDSFMDILETCYRSCEKSGNMSDYEVLCSSIYAAIAKAQNLHTDVDKLIGAVTDQLWKRNMKINGKLRQDIVKKLSDRTLKAVFENVPTFENVTFQKNQIKRIIV